MKSFVLWALFTASIHGFVPDQSGNLARDVKKVEQVLLGGDGAYFVIPFDKDTVWLMDGKKVNQMEFKADTFVWIYRRKDTATAVIGWK